MFCNSAKTFEKHYRWMKRIFTILFILTIDCIFARSAFAQNLDSVFSWGYQLQNPIPSEIAAAPFDLVVIDYSSDGTDVTAFTTEELTQMKSSGKKIIAYLSIGETEDYRFYFKEKWTKQKTGEPCNTKNTSNAPAWLSDANEDFCGNYKTRYWMKKWQNIIFGNTSGPKKSYLDRIIDAGFDGIYLDIIDAFEYQPFIDELGGERKAAKLMAKFVIALSSYARNSRARSDFIVIPQNGAGILDLLPNKLRLQYLNAIDGIGAEDTFYFGELDEDNEFDPQSVTITNIAKFVTAGKKVFSIDYLLDNTKIADYQTRACENSFIPQVSNRELDSLDFHLLDGCS